MNTTGIILFAHGSRDPLWKLPIEAVAQRIRQKENHTAVFCAYLELTTPDLAHCTREMIAAGILHVRILPLFLGVGRHAREDLPELVRELQAQHPGVHFELQAAVGEHPLLIDTIAQIALNQV
jgi:sirohydrochlorin cobaltochelatase